MEREGGGGDGGQRERALMIEEGPQSILHTETDSTEVFEHVWARSPTPTFTCRLYFILYPATAAHTGCSVQVCTRDAAVLTIHSARPSAYPARSPAPRPTYLSQSTGRARSAGRGAQPHRPGGSSEWARMNGSPMSLLHLNLLHSCQGSPQAKQRKCKRKAPYSPAPPLAALDRYNAKTTTLRSETS